MQLRAASILMVAGLCAFASAQFPVAVSLESKVDASGIVVLGTIASISRTPEPDSKERLTMVIQVSETFKGAAEHTLTVTTDANSPPDEYLAWQKKGIPILWFVDPAPSPGSADPVDQYVRGLSGGPLKQYPPGTPNLVHWMEALGDPGSDIHVVDMELQVLSTKAAVLDRVRQAVKEMPGTHSVTLLPPWYHPEVFKPDPDVSKRPTMHWLTYVPRSLKAGGVYLSVPICPRLETFAQKAIEHPKSVLPAEEATSAGHEEEVAKLRAAAIRALVYFKSPHNIELAKQYVNDPYLGQNDHGFRIVREAARYLLSGWQVEFTAAGRDPSRHR